MYRVWFDDLEKAIAALRAIVTDDIGMVFHPPPN